MVNLGAVVSFLLIQNKAILKQHNSSYPPNAQIIAIKLIKLALIAHSVKKDMPKSKGLQN